MAKKQQHSEVGVVDFPKSTQTQSISIMSDQSFESSLPIQAQYSAIISHCFHIESFAFSFALEVS